MPKRQPEAAEFKAWRDYASWVVATAGSDIAVAEYLGLSDGSRVGRWRTGTGKPSIENAIKLARWTGHDPLAILRLGGHGEVADLLSGAVSPPTVHESKLAKMLEAIRGVAEAAASANGVKEKKR
jgi:hypothetical protein